MAKKRRNNSFKCVGEANRDNPEHESYMTNFSEEEWDEVENTVSDYDFDDWTIDV